MSNNNNISPVKINWNIINWMRGLAALYVVVNHSRGGLFTNTANYITHIAPKDQWSLWEWLNIVLLQHTDLGTEFVILFFIFVLQVVWLFISELAGKDLDIVMIGKFLLFKMPSVVPLVLPP